MFRFKMQLATIGKVHIPLPSFSIKTPTFGSQPDVSYYDSNMSVNCGVVPAMMAIHGFLISAYSGHRFYVAIAPTSVTKQ